jgi:hypothetical protein
MRLSADNFRPAGQHNSVGRQAQPIKMISGHQRKTAHVLYLPDGCVRSDRRPRCRRLGRSNDSTQIRPVPSH